MCDSKDLESQSRQVVEVDTEYKQSQLQQRLSFIVYSLPFGPSRGQLMQTMVSLPFCVYIFIASGSLFACSSALLIKTTESARCHHFATSFVLQSPRKRFKNPSISFSCRRKPRHCIFPIITKHQLSRPYSPHLTGSTAR